MADLTEIRRTALRALIPPPKLRLSEWIEANVVLPADTSALPGPVRLWPYQKGIADAISDPAIERVTLVKAARLGFTTLLTGTIGAFIANEPAPILALLPTESDARDYVVSDVEPIFAASPALRGLLSDDVEEGERNTLLHRRFPGGSLKAVAARAPRNLRRHTARVLLIDEADAMETTAEGNPLRLAERRTLTFSNRKIVIGSTPVFEETSAVLQSYAASDMRVFEVPCPGCGAFTEILWQHIEWKSDRTDTAAFRCPHCTELIEERCKAAMVAQGRWRATIDTIDGVDSVHTLSEAKGTHNASTLSRHAGFRLNALVSLLANASWSCLAAEFVAAKESPEELQVFVNTVLAQGWREQGVELDEGALAGRAEDFDLSHIPPEVLFISAGIDCQTDRLECSIVGWTKTAEALVLSHSVIWGAPTDDETVWLEADQLLRSRFRHPFGASIGIDSTIIDSGFATESVYSFAFPRMSRKIFAGKGQAGSYPVLRMAKATSKSAHNGRLALIGADTVKSIVFSRLQHGRSIRFSKSVLEASPTYFEQLCSERRIIRYVRGRPVRRFERVSHRARAESLDCLCYAWAARSIVQVPADARETSLRNPEAASPPPAVYRSRFMEKHRAGR
jgi:phage terminase large subunit GpA-like protein